jgi:hypothetical protein
MMTVSIRLAALLSKSIANTLKYIQGGSMRKSVLLIAIAVSLAAVFFLGCADENTTDGTDVPPATPSTLIVQQTVRTQVNLSWSNVADEDSFIVQRSFDNSSWSTIARTTQDVLTYSDTGIHANQHHWYRVAAKNIAGTSSPGSPESIWTWTRVYDFAADHTVNFWGYCLDGAGDYLVWDWDTATETGKLGVADPAVDQFEVALVSRDTLPNQGYFEFHVKVPAWTGSTNRTEFEYYVERDQAEASDVVGIKFKSDSTRLIYYTTAGMTVVATNPQLPLMTANVWHTVRFFHYQTNRWMVYYDGTQIWDGVIDNVAEGSYGLIQEWQFNRGDDSNDQFVLLDDVANPNPFPSLLQIGGERSGQRSALDQAKRPVKK